MPIPTWQAAGLSLAVLVGHVLIGSGALVFGVLSIGVIWALHRLHGRAPESRTTAELIASVPGTAPARAVSVIQFAAYVVIAAYAARTVASIALIWLSSPEVTFPEWSQAALAVAVVAIASVGVGAMPTRVLAPVVTALAVFGLLVFFYVSLAVIAKVASGAAPIQPMFEMGATAAPTEWGPAALVVSLAIAFAGFEIPTVASHRLRSVGRPLGYAMALVVLCATLAWVATNMATTGDFRYNAGDLTQVATAMFGFASGFWLLLAATMAQAVAALLVLIWGAARVVRSARGPGVLPLVAAGVAATVVAALVAGGWADAGSKLWGVGGLLLLVVYSLAAQANSRLDDSSTAAWALFAVAGVVVAAVVILKGLAEGWWPVGVAAVILAAAAAWAVKRPEPPAPRPHPLR
jgi:hypothetical protein